MAAEIAVEIEHKICCCCCYCFCYCCDAAVVCWIFTYFLRRDMLWTFSMPTLDDFGMNIIQENVARKNGIKVSTKVISSTHFLHFFYFSAPTHTNATRVKDEVLCVGRKINSSKYRNQLFYIFWVQKNANKTIFETWRSDSAKILTQVLGRWDLMLINWFEPNRLARAKILVTHAPPC